MSLLVAGGLYYYYTKNQRPALEEPEVEERKQPEETSQKPIGKVPDASTSQDQDGFVDPNLDKNQYLSKTAANIRS